MTEGKITETTRSSWVMLPDGSEYVIADRQIKAVKGRRGKWRFQIRDTEGRLHAMQPINPGSDSEEAAKAKGVEAIAPYIHAGNIKGRDAAGEAVWAEANAYVDRERRALRARAETEAAFKRNDKIMLGSICAVGGFCLAALLFAGLP